MDYLCMVGGGGGALSAISQTQIDRPHPAYRCHGLSLQAVEFVIRSLKRCCACVSSGCHLLNVRLLRLFSPFIPIVHDSGFVSYVY